MRNTFRKPSGWRGESHRHVLAGKGIATKVKSSPSLRIDPIFYAQKHEEQVPFADIMRMVKQKMDVHQMVKAHPDADPEDVRHRGIQAVEALEAKSTLSTLDKNGVDRTVMMAKVDPAFKHDALQVLDNPQQVSFLHPAKASALKMRLGEVK